MLGIWIRETSTTNGSGNLTLSNVNGFPAFASQFANGELLKYAILDDATGAPFEEGLGYLSSGQLVRSNPSTTFLNGVLVSKNAVPIALPSGVKRVICTGGVHTAKTAAPGVWAASHKGYGDDGIHGAATTIMLVADRAYAMPFSASVESDIDGVKFSVTTAALTGVNAKIAVFSYGIDGLPGVKLAESAPIAVDSVGIKVGTFTRFKPPPRFFVAILSDGTPTLRAVSTGMIGANAMGFDSVLTANAFVHHNGASGLVFPSTWVPTGNLANASRPTLVCTCP